MKRLKHVQKFNFSIESGKGTGADQHRVDCNQKKEIPDADGNKTKLCRIKDDKIWQKNTNCLKGEVFFLLDPSFNG
jgi:hypothetical protein